MQDLLNLNLHERAADVSEVVVLAQKEARIDKKLSEITSTWEQKCLVFSLEREETPLLLPLDDIVETLEQHAVDLMTMISQGAVIDFCRSQVEEWQLKLRTVDTVLTVWMEVQRKWEVSNSVASIANSGTALTRPFFDVSVVLKFNLFFSLYSCCFSPIFFVYPAPHCDFHPIYF